MSDETASRGAWNRELPVPIHRTSRPSRQRASWPIICG